MGARIALIVLTLGLLLVAALPTAYPSAFSAAPPAFGHLPSSGNAGLRPLVASVKWDKQCGEAGSSSQCSPAPPNTRGGVETYDPTSGYVLEFGGTGTSAPAGATKNTTWSYVGPTAWTNLTGTGTTVNPTSRANGTLTWDTSLGATGAAVLFGGYTSTGTANYKRFLNDTWEWSDTAQAWMKVTTGPTTTPERRTGACAVYVPPITVSTSPFFMGGYVVLFGGADNFTTSAATLPYSTWTFNGAWQNVTAAVGGQAGSPTGRMAPACAWDPSFYDTGSQHQFGFGNGAIVVFGGLSTAGAPMNDTWVFSPYHSPSGAQWLPVVHANGAAGQPSPRFWSSMTYASFFGSDVLFSGGRNTRANVLNLSADSWAFANGTWTNVTTTVNPHTTSDIPPAGWDMARSDTPWNYAVVFGGESVNSGAQDVVFSLGANLVDTVSSNLGEMRTGATVTFYQNGTGGTGAGTYTYGWSGLPAGCVPVNASTITCSVSAAGVYLVTGTLTDAAGSSTPSTDTAKLVVDSATAATGTLSAGAFLDAVTPSFLIASVWSNMSTSATSVSHVAGLMNATGFRHLKFYGQFDKSDITTGRQYNPDGTFHAVTYNLTNYKLLCQFVGCTSWSLGAAAQVNNASLAAAEVRYVETTVHWNVPVWEIGVEPISWNHWGVPYASWKPTDNSAPNATQFASEVVNYTTAMLAADPTLHFTTPQLPMSYANNLEPFFVNVSKATCGMGGSVVAGGDDSYPLKKSGSDVNLANFYANLTVVPTVVGRIKANVTLGCPSNPFAVWVMETQAAQTKAPATWVPYMTGYDDVPWQAWTLDGVLKKGAQGFDPWIFLQDPSSENGWWDSMVNSSTGNPKPVYYLYSTLLTHLPWGNVYNASVVTSMNGTNAVRTSNATTTSYLVANTNTTVALKLTLPSAAGATVVLADDPTNGTQVHYYAVGNEPATWTIPPLGVLVLQMNGTGGGGGALVPNATNNLAALVGFAVFGIVVLVSIAAWRRD